MDTQTQNLTRGGNNAAINPPNHLRALREAAGYSLKDFAALIDVTSPSLSEYEKQGNSAIGKASLYRAAQILQTTIEAIDPHFFAKKVRRKS